MKSTLKNVLIFTSIILFVSCSSNKIDKSKIVGSWYFVGYTDESYSKPQLDEVEKNFKVSPKETISNFKYIFKKDHTYEYIIYDRLINKGNYSIDHDNRLILLDKMESKRDTLTVEYLDAQFLQVKGRRGERMSVYYKTVYKFPPIRTIEIN
jgi:hypothetical protein